MAMITDIGHTERGQNELMIDLLVNQGLNKFIKGLSVDLGISLDNAYHFQDVWSRQYQYNQVSPVVDATGAVVDTTDALYGTNTSMAFSTSVPYQWRRFTGLLDFKHTISWGNNQLNSVLLFQGDQLIILGRYNTYRHLLAAGNFNYSKAGKYFVDLGWSVNGTNILPESSRVGFFPALSLGWKLSEENFLKDVSAIDFMKLRASFGMTGNDQVIQNISTSPYVSGNGYRFTSSNSSAGGLREGRLASDPLTYETSYKSNIGVDATLFNLLDVNIDAFYNKRTGILVETRGSISGVIGVPLPYSSSGIVSNSGVELALNLHDDAGSFTYHIGGSLSYAKNKIIEMLEEYRPEEYLKRTGQSINQAFGLIDNGFFRDAGDISSSDVQTFSIVKPGDIKYVDQNEDNIINKYDEKPIGYSTQNPELYYAGSFGAQYKGFGVEALLQGISHMTVYLNTPSVFWPLRSNNNISTYSNDSWTPATAATATLPRLTTLENANNFRPNTIWYADGSYLKLRSIELYYKLPLSIISKVKLSSATIYFRGMNLLSFDKIDVVDPEAIGLDYPTLKTYNVGIKIGF
jgi:TonB-linked SusC/RagA family outer membrane protein